MSLKLSRATDQKHTAVCDSTVTKELSYETTVLLRAGMITCFVVLSDYTH